MPFVDLRSAGAGGALVFLATLAVLAPLTHGVVFGAGNDASRFAQIESLVDHRSASIERSRYSWTIDRIEIGGRLYSNKPPLLGLAGAALYVPLRAFGLSFEDPGTRPLLIRLLTLLLCGVPTAWLAARFDRALARYEGIGSGTRLLVTAALVFGTTLLPFSTTLNGHAPAAVLLFEAFLAAMGGRAFLAALLCGLASGVDTVPAVGLAPAFVFMLRSRRELARAGTGFLVAGLLYAAVNVATFGSALPAKAVPAAQDWLGHGAPAVPGARLLAPRHLYLAEGLFGWHGFFSISPVLLFGAAGLAWAAARRAPIPRSHTVAIGLAITVQIVGRCFFAALWGGWSYGFRYLIPVVPLLMFFAPAALGRWRTVLFAALFPVSLALSLIGVYNPWPPAYEHADRLNEVIERVHDPVGANLAAFLEEHVPGPLAQRAGEAFIAPEPGIRNRYLAYFYASKGDEERRRRYDRKADALGAPDVPRR